MSRKELYQQIKELESYVVYTTKLKKGFVCGEEQIEACMSLLEDMGDDLYVKCCRELYNFIFEGKGEDYYLQTHDNLDRDERGHEEWLEEVLLEDPLFFKNHAAKLVGGVGFWRHSVSRFVHYIVDCTRYPYEVSWYEEGELVGYDVEDFSKRQWQDCMHLLDSLFDFKYSPLVHYNLDATENFAKIAELDSGFKRTRMTYLKYMTIHMDRLSDLEDDFKYAKTYMERNFNVKN